MDTSIQTQKSVVRIYVPLIGDFVCSAILGFISITFLATGVVYPIRTNDQQLLKAWGLGLIFDKVLLLLLMVSLVLTGLIYHKSINEMLKTLKRNAELPISFCKTWFEFGPLGIVTGTTIFYIVESIAKWVIFSDPFTTSTVITSIFLYPLAGYVLGQLVKAVEIFLWEQRTSAKIFLNLQGKLIRKDVAS